MEVGSAAIVSLAAFITSIVGTGNVRLLQARVRINESVTIRYTRFIAVILQESRFLITELNQLGALPFSESTKYSTKSPPLLSTLVAGLSSFQIGTSRPDRTAECLVHLILAAYSIINAVKACSSSTAETVKGNEVIESHHLKPDSFIQKKPLIS